MVALIEPQAERNGMTVEEYVLYINKMIEEYPEKVAGFLNEELKKKHDKLSNEE